MERKIHIAGARSSAVAAFLMQAVAALGMMPGGASNKARAVRAGRLGPNSFAGRLKIAKAQAKRERRQARNLVNAHREHLAKERRSRHAASGFTGVWIDELVDQA